MKLPASVERQGTWSRPRNHPLRSALPLLWRDARERARWLDAIATAVRSGDPEALHAAVTHVDEVVAAGLRVLGLPRGPIARLVMEDFGRGWFGRKMPDCHLMFDRGRLLQAIRAPVSRDDVIRTWVHESLHGRQPYSRDHRQEADRWPGHEEGLAEGLARTLTGGIADMDIDTGSYAYYVAVYEALADVAGIDPERVLRGVWQAAPGDVCATLIDTVDTLRQDAWGRPLMAVQRQRLRALADTAFATERAKWLAGDRQALVRTWRVVLP